LELNPDGSLTAEHGFLYTPDGGLVTVDFPGVPYTLFNGVNQRGEVAAGVAPEPGIGYAAVCSSRIGTWDVLPDPDPSSVSSQAVAVNDRGELVGYTFPDSFDPSVAFVAFRRAK
jgi:hypothetical protein